MNFSAPADLGMALATRPALLRAEGVAKTYARAGGAPAVTDVSLEIEAGGVTGIVGESGSGKTTLARLMAGLLRPSQGQVWFDGIRLDSLGAASLRRLRRDLQYVHQDPAAALDPRMRLRAILEEPLLVHASLSRAARQAQVQEALAAVSLAETLLDRFPHQLSGGQQRRAGLARILILKPRLVIFDEPTAGLDLLVQASLLALLRDMQLQFGLTYVVVTHDLAVVESLCDRMVAMYRGRVVEQGATPIVLRDPCHPYLQALVGSRLEVGGPRLSGLPPPLDDQAAPPATGCAFLPRCPQALSRCAAERPVLCRIARRDVACWAVLAQAHHPPPQGETA